MAKIVLKSLPEKLVPDNTDILVIEDSTTHKITVANLFGNVLNAKQDKLGINPSTTSRTLTGLTIDDVSYKIESGSSNVDDVIFNGQSIVTNKIATVPNKLSNYNNDAGFEQTSNRVTTITDSSDNSHYPTAKAVYDLFSSITNLDEVSF